MTESPAPSSDRREQLLDAALRVFADTTIGESRIEDVTREAGVAKGTFYLYFRSKEELLAALEERFVDGMLAMTTAAAAALDSRDPWDLVDRYVESVVDYELDAGPVYELWVASGTGRGRAVEERCVAPVTGAIAAGRDAGSFAAEDPEATARFLYHGIEGLIRHHWLSGRDDRAGLVAAAQHLVRQVLLPR